MNYPDPQVEALPVVFDLDGTLAENTWPSPRIGRANPQAFKMLRHYANEGREIVIYTARPHTHQEAIWDWVHRHGIGNIVYDVVTGRPRAALYIDDRAVNILPFLEDEEPEPLPESERDHMNPEDVTYVG